MVGHCFIDVFNERSHRFLSMFAVQRIHLRQGLGDNLAIDATILIHLSPDKTGNVEEHHHGEQNKRYPLIIRTKSKETG